ncbi:hypothetical protein TorRG33x02_308420 [Trema orientale]|uniref:Uncharacterized protein n=1 Tax=Trema orientale TaxID=63057 RepID=A0A2P5BUE6_TREOI|nr:hypothetical protein TorRG33x02_308420 [Trema orientale]
MVQNTRCSQDETDISSPPKAKKLRSKLKYEVKDGKFSNPPLTTIENDNSPKKMAASEAKQVCGLWVLLICNLFRFGNVIN